MNKRQQHYANLTQRTYWEDYDAMDARLANAPSATRYNLACANSQHPRSGARRAAQLWKESIEVQEAERRESILADI